jgi:hypothetical protein
MFNYSYIFNDDSLDIELITNINNKINSLFIWSFMVREEDAKDFSNLLLTINNTENVNLTLDDLCISDFNDILFFKIVTDEPEGACCDNVHYGVIFNEKVYTKCLLDKVLSDENKCDSNVCVEKYDIFIHIMLLKTLIVDVQMYEIIEVFNSLKEICNDCC